MKNNWLPVTLKQITTKIGSGATPRGGKEAYKTSGITLIRSMNVYDFQFEYNGLAYIDEKQAAELSNVAVERNDILLNITGASVARCCMVPEKLLPARVNQHVSIVRVDPSLADAQFVLNVLNSPFYKQYLLTIAQGGATREALTKEKIENFEIPFPSLPIQHKIAAVLSAYDDLIEVNTRRIRLLEEMAQAVYREWFGSVDAASLPEGWEIKTFGNVSENYDRQRIPVSKIEREKMQGKYPYYGASGIIDHVNDYIFDGRYLLIAEDGENLNSRKSPVAFFANGKFWVNNHAHIVQAKPPITLEFLYFFFANKDISGFITGAAQPKLSQRNLNDIPIVVPTQEKMDKFNSLAQPAMQEVEILQRQNANLRRTRDLLLPRLVSGEVGVSGVEVEGG